MMIIDEIKTTMEYIEKITKHLNYPISSEIYTIENQGCPHIKPKLPKNNAAIYIFILEKGNDYEFLKIGKANKKSGARYSSQHYGLKRGKSTLAKSLCADPEFIAIGVNKDNVEEWMLENLYRVNILIESDQSKAITELVESVFHYKYRPRYEGNI